MQDEIQDKEDNQIATNMDDEELEVRPTSQEEQNDEETNNELVRQEEDINTNTEVSDEDNDPGEAE